MSNLAFIAKQLDGMSEDIRALLADLDQTDAERTGRVITDAQEFAARTARPAYLRNTACGLAWDAVPPSKYYEGRVIVIQPNGLACIQYFDGDRAN